MKTAERVYGLLLLVYPAELRAEYGRDMLVTFRDARRERVVSESRFWLDIIRDIARVHAPHAVMNTIAMMALFAGVVLGQNAIVETIAGGGLTQEGASLAVLGATAAAGVMLLVCGSAMWRRTPNTRTIVRRAATCCLVLVSVMAIYQPIISIFGRLLGLTIPLALLLLTRTRRDARPAL